MNEEEKKAVEILNSWYSYNKKNRNKLLEADKIIKVQETILNLIENQQKELSNLKEIEQQHKEENGKLRVELEQEKEKNKTKVDIKDIEFSNFIKERYVSKDKIKEKIEETNNEKLNYSEDEYYLENEIKGYAIDKLKELLEEK